MIAYRLPTVKQRFDIKQDFQANILEWGGLNVYPQSQHEYMLSSGITSSAVKLLENFLTGDGFVDERFANTIVNLKGQTANQLLSMISRQKSWINSVCLHIGYNALLEVATINILPVQYYRLVKRGDNKGKIALWNNWAGENSWNLGNDVNDIKYLNPFNPANVEQEIEDCGGFEYYHGQVFILNWEEYNHYSRSTFDSVIDDVITDAALANYRKNNVKSAFSASGILKYNANVESEEERQAILNEIASYQGDDEAGNVVVLFPTEGEQETNSPLEFTPIQPSNIDGLYKNQEDSIQNRIIGNYQQPRSLHTIFDNSGVFNEDQMINSFLWYNGKTKKGRSELSEVFELIVPFMDGIYQPESYDIKPLMFGDGQSKGQIESDGTPQIETPTQPQTEEIIEDAPGNDSQEKLRGSVGGLTGILEIKKAISEGVMTDENAIVMMKELFGFDDQTARQILL